VNLNHDGAADLDFDWALESKSWKSQIELLPKDLRIIADHYIQKYNSRVSLQVAQLRHTVLYHDANDYNVIVTSDRSIGFIDFGDCHHGPLIQEIAICLAYVLMDQSDVAGAAREVIQGYHSELQLQPEELEVLQELICIRLITSLVYAAVRKIDEPDNTYWQISAGPASDLLKKIHQIHPSLMLCYFRSSCGMEPSRDHLPLNDWLVHHRAKFEHVLGFDLSDETITVFDWSVKSHELGNMNAQGDLKTLTYNIFQRMSSERTRVGVGRYDEPRPVYTSHEYEVPGLHTPGMRTVHLGIDLFMPPGTPVYAPLDGTVVTLANNAGDKEYGPLVILEHQTNTELSFYSLYGHNNIYTLSLLRVGQQVRAGEKIAEIGDYPENGNWVPHLHFQILTDPLGYVDDFPGVADPDVRDIWLSLCPDPNLILGIRHPNLKYHYADVTALVRKRTHILGSNLSTSNHIPLHIVRGWKSTLFDEYGRSYLDTVNNIAHVGHEHPDVVHAGQQQMAVLNTNTRYLHPQILKCAQQLQEKLPSHLEVIWFVNSGSEANELALRIARMSTGNTNTLVLEEGYHGNTQACVDVSQYKIKHLGRPLQSHVVPLSLFVNPVGQKDLAEFYQDHADGPLVFIHESIPGCAGQVIPDQDFFLEMYAMVKRDGGICIADEIQTGLGRMGSHMWAFELFTIAPDIVTIGKPLGNGHPVAAVACTRALADRFAEGPEFFSSFGGNPVSCSIASEVLSVIEREDLQSHALQLGADWKDQLIALQRRYPVIGDVRGIGLFLGIEFVDPESSKPSAAHANYVVERMLEHRILTSLDGPHGNVMKIKPPMCITQEEVNRFMEVLEKVLGES
jgi:4-aminobutyrate aminotransferase-like enzyme